MGDDHPKVTRRELLRRAGVSAAALPLVGAAGCTDGARTADAEARATAPAGPTARNDPAPSVEPSPPPVATQTARRGTQPAMGRQFMRLPTLSLPPEGAGNGMNVLIVILDSLRRDHVGAYGNPGMHTPSIDELARASTRFTEARPEAMPTVQVRRCVHTGRRTFPARGWTPQKGVGVRMPGWERIPEDQVTLAEMLQSAGYTTVLLTDTPHLFQPSMNFQRGFDTWSFVRDPQLTRLLEGRPARRERDLRSPQVFTQARNWLSVARQSQPFLLVVDSYDPHEPWVPPVSYIERYDEPRFNGSEPRKPQYGSSAYLTEAELARMDVLYSAEVTLADAWFGRFLDAFEGRGLLDSTLVVVLSDHGVLLGEHGLVGKPVEASLWPEITDIPLLMRHPERRRGAIDDRWVSTHDIVPTVLGALGIAPPVRLDGIDLSPVLRGDGSAPRRSHLTMGYAAMTQVRRGRWAFTTNSDGSSRQLYDVREDPQMTADVASQHPKIVRSLADLIEKDAGGPLPVYDSAAVVARMGERT